VYKRQTGDSTPKLTVNKGGSLSGIGNTAKKAAKKVVEYAVFGGNADLMLEAGKKALNYVSSKFKEAEGFQSTKQQTSKGGSGLNFNAGFEALPQDVQDKMDPQGKSDKAPVNYKQEPGKAPMLRNCGSSRYKK
jgi:hypothetical protein